MKALTYERMERKKRVVQPPTRMSLEDFPCHFPGNQARWGNEIFHVKGPAGLAIPWRRDPEAERSGMGGTYVTTSAT